MLFAMLQKARLYTLPAIALIALSLASLNLSANVGKPRSRAVVTIAQAELTRISSPISAMGTLIARQSVTITPQVSGRITELNLQDGKKIRQGELLLRLDDREQAARVAETAIALKNQKRKLADSETLYKRKAVSKDALQAQQAQVDLLKASLQAEQAKLDYYTLKAPFDGVLGFTDVGSGALINSGTAITTLDDISTVKVDIELPEGEFSQVAPGTSLTASTRAWPEQVFSGTVTSINSRINPSNLTFKARAVFDNASGLLRPGMLMTISIEKPAREQLTVPTRSVLYQGNNRYVYVLSKDNVAEKRLIETGQNLGDRITVLKGLAAGEIIVDQGVVKVREGSQVSISSTTTAVQPEDLEDSRS